MSNRASGIHRAAARLIVCALVLLSAVPAFALKGDTAAANIRVAAIEIKGEITRGMRNYIASEFERADHNGSEAVVLLIDTPGGSVADALKIQQIIENAPMRVCAYVTGDALSAGVLLALSADALYMAPGTNIGSAETIPNDEKTLSFWTGELRSAAELRGRDGELYAAMADKRIEIPGVTKAGMLLNLSAQQAQKLGAIDGIADTATEAASFVLVVPEYAIILETRTMSPSVLFAQFITSNAVSSLLLSLALFMLIAELFTPGFGVFGVLSLIAFGLYFGGGLLAGYSQWWTVVLFAVGAGLLLGEMAMPGFGLLGIGGLVCVALALFFNARDFAHFLSSLAVAVVTCSVAIPLMAHFGKKSGLMKKLVRGVERVVEHGFVSHAQEESMEGSCGVALTALRPAGIILVDERRVDAVSRGDFIPQGVRVRVVRQEGGKVLVEREKETSRASID